VILALDTSDGQASVALCRDGLTMAEWSWDTAGNHSRHLHLAVQQMLALLSVSVRDVTALIVAKGPGSFSGLRVGVSFAKGLAMALDVPLAGISTLDAIAFQASAGSESVWATMPAGRSQVYTGRFEGQGVTWRRGGEYMMVSEEEMVAVSADGGLLAGPAAHAIAARAALLGKPRDMVPQAWQLRRAAFLAELGKQYFDRGGVDEASTLEPLYLRRSSAEEKRASLQE